MITIYWLCFLVGGAFVVLSAIGGIDGADFDSDLSLGIDTDWPVDVDSSLDVDIDVVAPGELATHRSRRNQRRFKLSPIQLLRSLKFWTFGVGFFGLTGVVLSTLAAALPPGLILGLAIAVGLLCGTVMAGSLQWLYRRQADSLIRSTDLVGLMGTVELPFDADSRGKVRLRIRGSTVDFIAFTDDAQGFDEGDAVLVVGSENNRLWVVSARAVGPPPAP